MARPKDPNYICDRLLALLCIEKNESHIYFIRADDERTLITIEYDVIGRAMSLRDDRSCLSLFDETYKRVRAWFHKTGRFPKVTIEYRSKEDIAFAFTSVCREIDKPNQEELRQKEVTVKRGEFRGIFHGFEQKEASEKIIHDAPYYVCQQDSYSRMYKFDVRNLSYGEPIYFIEEGRDDVVYGRYVHHPLRDSTFFCSKEEWLFLKEQNYERIHAEFQRFKATKQA